MRFHSVVFNPLVRPTCWCRILNFPVLARHWDGKPSFFRLYRLYRIVREKLPMFFNSFFFSHCSFHGQDNDQLHYPTPSQTIWVIILNWVGFQHRNGIPASNNHSKHNHQTRSRRFPLDTMTLHVEARKTMRYPLDFDFSFFFPASRTKRGSACDDFLLSGWIFIGGSSELADCEVWCFLVKNRTLTLSVITPK